MGGRQIVFFQSCVVESSLLADSALVIPIDRDILHVLLSVSHGRHVLSPQPGGVPILLTLVILHN